MNIMAGICLFIQGIWDIRAREIPTWISLCFGGCSFLYSVCNQRAWSCIGLALIPGIVCLILGYVTREAVGYGDGLLLCALGMLYSLEELASICVTAFFSAGMIGLVLLVIFRKKGNYEIPFVPFLFVGWGFEYVINKVGGVVI